MTPLRRYHLATEDTGGSDTTYSLVFTEDGQMFVQARVGYEQPYKSGEICNIMADRFPTFMVNGIPLSHLVGKKLDEVLKPKPLEWPDIPQTIS